MRKTSGGWEETAPFPKSRASYFRFARFNASPLYYLRAWHRLLPICILSVNIKLIKRAMKSDCGLLGVHIPEGRIRMNKTLI